MAHGQWVFDVAAKKVNLPSDCLVPMPSASPAPVAPAHHIIDVHSNSNRFALWAWMNRVYGLAAPSAGSLSLIARLCAFVRKFASSGDVR